MTQEEKARAYDEALERARKMLDMILNNELLGFPGQIREIFPELRESEDERIRKAIIGLIEELQRSDKNFAGVELADMLTYLEKQKELPFVKDVVLGLPGLYFYDGERMHFRGSPAIEEKQKEPEDVSASTMIPSCWEVEQKPVEYLSKDKVYAIMNKLTELSTSELIPLNSDEYKKINEITSDVRSLLDYPIGQNPAEWSKEDEKMLENIRYALRYAYFNSVIDEQTTEYVMDWFKSLRPQQKQETHDYFMPHKEFFQWIYDRLVHVHKENPDVDYMRSFKERLNNLSFGEKQEWSEEDSDNLERVDNYLWMLDDYVSDDCATPQGKADKIRGNIQEVLSPWIKSLPERFNLQPKQEWSEEDEDAINGAIGILLDDNSPNFVFPEHSKLSVGEIVKRLKSLRPSWKPNENEERLINTSISFLKDFADKGYENAVECIDWLKSKLNGNSCK